MATMWHYTQRWGVNSTFLRGSSRLSYTKSFHTGACFFSPVLFSYFSARGWCMRLSPACPLSVWEASGDALWCPLGCGPDSLPWAMKFTVCFSHLVRSGNPNWAIPYFWLFKTFFLSFEGHIMVPWHIHGFLQDECCICRGELWEKGQRRCRLPQRLWSFPLKEKGAGGGRI